MATKRKLEVELIGDDKSLKRVLGSAAKDASKFAKDTERAHSRVGKSFSGMAATAVKAGAGMAAAYVSIAGARKAVKTTEDLGKATISLSKNLGLTVEQASRWAAVAGTRNIETKQLAQSFGVLAKNSDAARTGLGKQAAALGDLGDGHKDVLKKQALLAKGAGTQAEMFKKLGVSQATLKSGDFNRLLGETADGFAKMAPGAERTALGMKLFGRGWQTVLPILRDGSKSMNEQLALADKYGVTLHGKTVKSIQEMVSAQRESKFASMGLQVALGTAVIPTITKVVSAVAQFVAGMRTGAGAGGAFVAKVSPAFAAVKGSITGVVSTLKDLVTGFQHGKTSAVAIVTALAGLAAAVTVVKAITIATRAWAAAQIALDIAVSANPFVIAAAAIVGLGVALVIAYKKSEKFRAIVTGVFHAVSSAAKAVANAISGPLGVAVGVARGYIKAYAAVARAIGRAILKGFEVVSGVVKTVNNLAQAGVKVLHDFGARFYELGANLIKGLVSGIKSGASAVADAVSGVATGAVDKAKGLLGIKSPSKVFEGIGQNIGEGLVAGLSKAKSRVGDAVKASVLFPIDAAIARLQLKRKTLEDTWAQIDALGEKNALRAGLARAIRTPIKFSGGAGSSGGSSSGGGRLAVIAGGKALQGMGLQVGESKYFGGVTTNRHAHYKNDHYSGNSIDVNAAGGGPGELSKLQAALAAIRKRFGKQIQMALIEDVGAANQHLHITFKNLKTKGQAAAKKGAVKVSGKIATIQAAAKKAGIPPALLYGLWGAESNFGRNKGPSAAGAVGDFQFMPSTAIAMGINPHNFRSAASGAARYLARYKNRGIRGMLAAYNAGPAGNPNNPETRAYIPKVLAFAKRFKGAGAGDITSNAGERAGNIKDARNALADFNKEAGRAKILARIDAKITGLERLKAWKDALAGIRSEIKDRLSGAVDNFRENWENTTGKAIDKANAAILQSFDDMVDGVLKGFDRAASGALDAFDKATAEMVKNSPASQALAAMQAEDVAKQIADEDKANAKALADAQKMGGFEGFGTYQPGSEFYETKKAAIDAAQAAIDATARTRAEAALQLQVDAETAAIEAARAVERLALEDQQGAQRLAIERKYAGEREALEVQMATDRQTRADTEAAEFEKAEAKKFKALEKSLKNQTTSYAEFVKDVNKELRKIGADLYDPNADVEFIITAGPRDKNKGKATGGMIHTAGVYRVGELGAENVRLPRGALVSQASQSKGGSGGAVVNIENYHAHGRRDAEVFGNQLAYRVAFG